MKNYLNCYWLAMCPKIGKLLVEVAFKNVMSDGIMNTLIFSVSNGVKQLGSVISPLLFSI